MASPVAGCPATAVTPAETRPRWGNRRLPEFREPLIRTPCSVRAGHNRLRQWCMRSPAAVQAPHVASVSLTRKGSDGSPAKKSKGPRNRWPFRARFGRSPGGWRGDGVRGVSVPGGFHDGAELVVVHEARELLEGLLLFLEVLVEQVAGLVHIEAVGE